MLLFAQAATAQDCKTSADLYNVTGKYLTAAEYPWPAARAEYFNKMVTPAGKATAKQVLGQIEKLEQQSRTGFTITGGNWENTYSTEGNNSLGNARLGKYTFQSAFHAFFCNKGKMIRNDEYSTVLRIYVNAIPLNTLNPLLQAPFGSSLGEYDFNLQYADFKNHKPVDVDAPLISLFSYLSCTSESLIDAINSGNSYFQDVPEKNVKLNDANTFIYRYWFISKKNVPLLLPVSRREYLQSLLEYYEREKLHFPMLVTKLTKDHNKGVARYASWETDVNDKITVVKKALADHKEDWLSAQAVINRIEDASLTYKANLTEKTNYNRFWRFYDNEKRSEPLYKYNPAYFKDTPPNTARPQLISVAFRYVTMPPPLRLVENFTKHFDFEGLRKLVE